MSEAEADKLDEVTEAIQAAKEFLLKAFQGERIENLGLEEVKRGGPGNTWDITLGFTRRWDYPQPENTFLQMAAAAAARPQRTLPRRPCVAAANPRKPP